MQQIRHGPPPYRIAMGPRRRRGVIPMKALKLYHMRDLRLCHHIQRRSQYQGSRQTMATFSESVRISGRRGTSAEENEKDTRPPCRALLGHCRTRRLAHFGHLSRRWPRRRPKSTRDIIYISSLLRLIVSSGSGGHHIGEHFFDVDVAINHDINTSQQHIIRARDFRNNRCG